MIAILLMLNFLWMFLALWAYLQGERMINELSEKLKDTENQRDAWAKHEEVQRLKYWRLMAYKHVRDQAKRIEEGRARK